MISHHPKPATQTTSGDAERGASAVEYALLLALLAVVVFSAVSFFGSSTGGGFNNSANCVAAAYGVSTTGVCH